MNISSNHSVKNGWYMALGIGIAGLAAGFFAGQRFDSARCAETDTHVLTSQDRAHGACQEAEDEHGHEHEHEHAAVGADLHELDDMQCEHSIGIVECDECRYEAGMVKLDPAAGSLIRTAVVESGDLMSTLRLTGQVTFDQTRTVDVVLPAGGRILDVAKRPGDCVQKGDILAVLHSPEFGQLKADYLEAQAALELAEATFAREQDLVNRNMTSQADYLQSANTLKSARASIAACDKRLRLFGLNTDQIKAIESEHQNGNFAELSIVAPQDGTIIAQDLSKGQLIASGDTLFRISDLSVLWVRCDVYEKQLAALQNRFTTGEPIMVSVRTNASANTFSGTVDLIGQVMDERTRTVKMRILVDNPNGGLKPGMFAEIEVTLPSGAGLSIPQSAVLSDEGTAFVFQQWKDRLWVRRDVTVGRTFDDRIEILGGIEPGETIVTSGAFMLKSDILREKMGAGCAD